MTLTKTAIICQKKKVKMNKLTQEVCWEKNWTAQKQGLPFVNTFH
jgi:hypothetical protein